MAPYHILIVIISSVIPENLVLLTKSEQSGPKSAHIRPTIVEIFCLCNFCGSYYGCCLTMHSFCLWCALK